MSFSDLSVIKALKSGRVPRKGALQLAVGRDPEIAELRRVVDYVAEGFSEVRFLRGDYGAGKTFMCSVLREIAFAERFAVSIVNLSREIPFGRRELVLSEILLGLRTEESGPDSALGPIIDRWLEKHDGFMPLEGNAILSDAINKLGAADPMLAMALRGYQRALLDDDGVLMEAALAYIRGETITSEARRGLKLAGRLAPEGAFRRLRAVLALLRDAGYPGLLILVDEAETIQRLNKPQRDAAYTAIREIVDSCEEAFPFCLFVFAGTQPLFEDESRGIASYPPLFSRIKNTQEGVERDLRQPILRLEDLGRDALVAVARRVRALHATAYGWNAETSFPDRALNEFVVAVASRFGDIRQKPRGFLKALVDVLDARQQGLHLDLDDVAKTIEAVESAVAGLDDDVVIASA